MSDSIPLKMKVPSFPNTFLAHLLKFIKKFIESIFLMHAHAHMCLLKTVNKFANICIIKARNNALISKFMSHSFQ